MRKLITSLCSIALLFIMLPWGVFAVGKQGDVIVNVKDFGAVGDGQTDDSGAMVAAINYAVSNYASKDIPVTVYFPEGEYGLLSGGMYIRVPFGSGYLTIKGAGADKSKIVYLEDWVNTVGWVALRLQLEGTPRSVDDYMHDVTIEDLGVHDTNPVKHAWHVDNGDPGTEETHGFNIKNCVRATMRNCKVTNVGDEALDMSYCIDSQIIDNYVENSPGAGNDGGGISVGDGSRNVVISNNVIVGSVDNPAKTNWAIAVEALSQRVEDVIIKDNVISDINGYGINIGAPAGTIANVLAQGNVITNCRDGGIRLSSSGQTDDTVLRNNTISNTPDAICLEGNKDRTIVEYCTIDAVSKNGVKIAAETCDDTIIRNTTITNAQRSAIYNAGINTKIDHVLIDGVGLAGGVTSAAITQWSPTETATDSCSEVTNTVILNCLNKRGTQDVQMVTNTLIEQEEVAAYIAISGAKVIKNCKVNRFIRAKKNGVIDGVIVCAAKDLGTNGIMMSSTTDCTISNSVFVTPSRYAVSESGTSNNNVLTDNVLLSGYGIKTVGANTVASGNMTGKMGTTETFRYRTVDGKVTIMELLDTETTEVVIPATINNYPVVAIDAWAFVLCDELTTVTIPDGVTSIGANAFYLCDALIDVYYCGTEAEKELLNIGDNNDDFLDATWHYHLHDETCNVCGSTHDVSKPSTPITSQTTKATTIKATTTTAKAATATTTVKTTAKTTATTTTAKTTKATTQGSVVTTSVSSTVVPVTSQPIVDTTTTESESTTATESVIVPTDLNVDATTTQSTLTVSTAPVEDDEVVAVPQPPQQGSENADNNDNNVNLWLCVIAVAVISSVISATLVLVLVKRKDKSSEHTDEC